MIERTTLTEVLSPAQTRQRMRTSIASALGRLSTAPVPIFVMVGTPSVHGGVTDTAHIEPGRFNPIADTRTADLLQQADVYQALFEVINASPTGNGRVMGVLSWGYSYIDDFYDWNGLVNTMAFDKSATIRGKPSEAVMASWFQGIGANDSPVAIPQEVTMIEGSSRLVTLAGQDADGDPLTFSIGATPAHGSLSGFDGTAGLVTYTPAPGFSGVDSFTFRVNDSSGDSAPATVAITVMPGRSLNLAVGGSAGGVVQLGSLAGPCSASCTVVAALDSVVSLTAVPDAGATFARWDGACAGSGPVCTVTMSSARSAAAIFSRVFVDSLVPRETSIRSVHSALGAVRVSREPRTATRHARIRVLRRFRAPVRTRTAAARSAVSAPSAPTLMRPRPATAGGSHEALDAAR